MHRTFLAATTFIALGTAAPAFAADHACNVPMADWQPREQLQQKLEAEGMTVKRIKTEDGCYEAYALDKNGKRVEAYFDPRTLERLRKKDDD